MNSFSILRSQNIVRCFNSMRYAYRPISVSASLLNKAVSLDEPVKVHYEEESDGSIPKNPIRIPWGLLKVSAVLVPSIWAGAALSRKTAAYLEENDIFIPEDDDD